MSVVMQLTSHVLRLAVIRVKGVRWNQKIGLIYQYAIIAKRDYDAHYDLFNWVVSFSGAYKSSM